jgi:hypothetical protein
MTLLEVAIAAVIVASIMVVSNAAFLSSFSATERAQDLRSVGLLLGTVMEDVAAQPYDNLLSLNGNQVFNGANAASSRVRVTIETFQSEVDLIQVRAVATELDSGREVGRVVSLRSAR